MIRELGVPVTALAATASDVYRKPKTGTGVKRVCNNSNNSKRGGGERRLSPFCAFLRQVIALAPLRWLYRNVASGVRVDRRFRSWR